MCIITTEANNLVAPIHERMPVLISPYSWNDWLGSPSENLERLLAPYPETSMQTWAVDRRVSRTTEDGAGLILEQEITE